VCGGEYLSNCRRFFLVSVIVAFLFVVVGFSVVYAAQTETVQVDAGYAESLVFNLDGGDRFSGSLSISGGGGSDIDFLVTNPQGITIVNLGRVSQGATFEFTAEDSGAYTLRFDNGFSVFSSKTVSLSYDVQVGAGLGFAADSLMWIILIAVVVVVLALIIYALIRRRNKPSNPPSPPL
jgi:hypothetical protein